ncbi:MAG: 4-hydroxybenzoate octaprenyltransferase [Chloroflexi bacterium]|nr:4-hydroxybenzoate octaprenyltransferase [Chloroflexota bacterium]MEE2925737.1 UbiA-like polyprenyltransferase [Chloroflexota bacterium]HIB13277.1 4-hydroxybenzoate octaprenyltransferase [Dehalococcoidia bacterium]|tara:strand:+ start:1927 stop:2805 length:879 start_codon:yes stop_codon:yes gene_type:complete
MTVTALPARAIIRVPYYLASIRVWESLFALPFAYMGMVLAAGGWPRLSTFIWITLAMAGARTLAMSANRYIHRKEDAANPRTANRHLPKGLLKPWEVVLMAAVGLGVFLFAASQLNPLAFALAPVAAVYVVLYSYAKYHTWTCNLLLGWSLAIAPIGAWVAVTGTLEPQAVLLAFAVATWAGGFDILYTCSDYEFDGKYGIHSIPRRFGFNNAFHITRGLHFLSAVSLLALGFWMGLNYFYYIGWAFAVSLLVFESGFLKPDDLSKLNAPFFKYNSGVSMLHLGFTILALVV